MMPEIRQRCPGRTFNNFDRVSLGLSDVVVDTFDMIRYNTQLDLERACYHPPVRRPRPITEETERNIPRGGQSKNLPDEPVVR
eukprot:9227952-Pyramimonas_sp.AAC.1